MSSLAMLLKDLLKKLSNFKFITKTGLQQLFRGYPSLAEGWWGNVGYESLSGKEGFMALRASAPPQCPPPFRSIKHFV